MNELAHMCRTVIVRRPVTTKLGRKRGKIFNKEDKTDTKNKPEKRMEVSRVEHFPARCSPANVRLMSAAGSGELWTNLQNVNVFLSYFHFCYPSIRENQGGGSLTSL